MEKGACLHTLREHIDPVYLVAFSPDGRLVASGSFDQWLYLWSNQVWNFRCKQCCCIFRVNAHTPFLMIAPCVFRGLVRVRPIPSFFDVNCKPPWALTRDNTVGGAPGAE